MPGFDRSGPMGSGPMTGGRRGLCGNAGSGYDTPMGYGRGLGMRRGFRAGFAPGRGGGRGFGPRLMAGPRPYGYNYPANWSDEIEMLKAEAGAMQASLTAVQKRIAELEKDSKNQNVP